MHARAEQVNTQRAGQGRAGQGGMEREAGRGRSRQGSAQRGRAEQGKATAGREERKGTHCMVAQGGVAIGTDLQCVLLQARSTGRLKAEQSILDGGHSWHDFHLLHDVSCVDN